MCGVVAEEDSQYQLNLLPDDFIKLHFDYSFFVTSNHSEVYKGEVLKMIGMQFKCPPKADFNFDLVTIQLSSI